MNLLFEPASSTEYFFGLIKVVLTDGQLFDKRAHTQGKRLERAGEEKATLQWVIRLPWSLKSFDRRSGCKVERGDGFVTQRLPHVAARVCCR